MGVKSNISLEELQSVLQKSGLPGGSSFEMGQAKLGSRQAIASQIPNRSGGTRKRIMDQLAQVAAMDQKLGGVYGDPTSPMFIENPVSRDRASHMAGDTGYKEASRLGDQADAEDAQREADISEAESTYSQLTSAQKALEGEQKRLETEGKKQVTEATKKAGTIKNVKGETVFELSKEQTRQARNAKVDLKDAKAVSEFVNKSPAAFRNYLEDEGIDGRIKSSLTAKKIAEMRTKWEKEQTKSKASKSATQSKATKDAKSGGKSKKSLF